MKKQVYLWKVNCPGMEAVEILAADKLGAIVAAAQKWNVQWTQIARDCDCLRMRKDRPR